MPNRKTVFGAIAFVMFLLMVGTAGAIENDAVPLLPGTIRLFAFLGLWAFFSDLAGAFDYTSRERRKPREVQAENPDRRPSRTSRQGPGSSGRAKNYR